MRVTRRATAAISNRWRRSGTQATRRLPRRREGHHQEGRSAEEPSREIMILVFMFIVVFITRSGVLILIVEARNPEATLGHRQHAVVIGVGILGALLGLIAGKATNGGLSRRPDGVEPDLATPPAPHEEVKE